MSELSELLNAKAAYVLDGQAVQWQYDMFTAIVERLEPEQKAACKWCGKPIEGQGFGNDNCRDGKAWFCSRECAVNTPKADDGDDWLAECEANFDVALLEYREGDRVAMGTWADNYGYSLLAAAKEREELRFGLESLRSLNKNMFTHNGTLTAELAAANAKAATAIATMKRLAAKFRHPRVKGPRSKPSEVRARIKREARRVGAQWHTGTGVSCVILSLDDIEARGYSYCNQTDHFTFAVGEPLARCRAQDALENALKSGESHGELLSKDSTKAFWTWERIR